MSLPTLFENPQFDSDSDATRPLLRQQSPSSPRSIKSEEGSIDSAEYSTVKSTLTSPAASDALRQAGIFVGNTAGSPLSHDLENLSSGAFTANVLRRNGSQRHSELYFTDSRVPADSSPQFTLGVELRTPSQPNTPHSTLNDSHFNPALHLAPQARTVVAPTTRVGSQTVELLAPNNGCGVFMEAINQTNTTIDASSQAKLDTEMDTREDAVAAASNQEMLKLSRLAGEVKLNQREVSTPSMVEDSELPPQKDVISSVGGPEKCTRTTAVRTNQIEKQTGFDYEPDNTTSNIKANRRLSALSIANSLSAILNVVNEPTVFDRNEPKSSLDEPRESETVAPLRETPKKNRKSWIRSHTRPQRVSMLMEHAAITARAYKNGRDTDHNMSDWTKDLDASLENLIITRFSLDIPKVASSEPTPPKGIYRKTLARVSQYFTPPNGSNRSLYSLKSANSSHSSIFIKHGESTFNSSMPNVSLSSVQEDEPQLEQSIELSVGGCNSIPEEDSYEAASTDKQSDDIHTSSPDSAEFCDAQSTFEPVAQHYQLIPSAAVSERSVLSRKSPPSESVLISDPGSSVESSVRSRRSLFRRRNPSKGNRPEKKVKKRYQLLAFFGYRSRVETL